MWLFAASISVGTRAWTRHGDDVAALGRAKEERKPRRNNIMRLRKVERKGPGVSKRATQILR